MNVLSGSLELNFPVLKPGNRYLCLYLLYVNNFNK